MSEPELPGDAAAEARAIRRRWITLGEMLAVVAVAISGLTLWNSYDERKTAAAERAEAARAAPKPRAAELIAWEQNGGASLAFKGAGCALQNAEIAFPTALGVPSRSTVLEHTIRANWFDDALLKLTDGGPDRATGVVPVAIEFGCEGLGTGYMTEAGIYDIAYEIAPGFLTGRGVELRGMTRRAGGGGQARLNAVWAKVKPVVQK